MMKLTEPYNEIQLSNEQFMNYRIGSMEIYQFDCLLLKKRIPGISKDCTCGLFKISSRGINGWAECILPAVEKRIDLIQWASVFIKLKGLSLPDSLEKAHTCREGWGKERYELAESALLHLAWQLQHPDEKATSELLNPVALERAYLIDQAQAYFSF